MEQGSRRGTGLTMRERVERARREEAEAEQYELALALSKSLAASQQREERPREAAANAAAAAIRRAEGIAAAPPPRQGSGSGTGRLPPRQQLPPMDMRQTQTYSAEFNAAVEAALDVWSTNAYASNSFLQDIGHTKRTEQRDRIRDQLGREWAAAGRPIYEVDYAQRFGEGPGRRLGGR